ncbi:hypothetical protein V499_01358 [Pseudogymnoascus sp. VKM F-103]|nr:hypothetical protein V499_01358 [Pseudogymnoascus sp. VKM F-103]
MASWTIQVTNSTSSTQTYFIYQQPPDIQGVPSFSCITFQQVNIKTGQQGYFRIPTNYLVVCGSSPNIPLAPGVVPSISRSSSLTSGSENVMIDVTPSAGPTITIHSAKPSEFLATIKTEDPNFEPNDLQYQTQDHVFCGLGITDPSNNACSTTVWEIIAPTSYNVQFPPNTFYIGFSATPVIIGDIVSSSTSSTWGEITFTDSADPFCKVTQNSDLTFTVSSPTSAIKET